MSFSDSFDTTNQGPAVSNREDLTDVLTILAPEETPVLSSASKQKANATFVEWTVDKLSDPVTAGIDEGADVTAFTDKFAARARLGNYIQKFRRDYMVSDLQEAVDSVGPAKIAQAEAKAIRELKRDVEETLVSSNDRNAENGAGQPYTLRGLANLLKIPITQVVLVQLQIFLQTTVHLVVLLAQLVLQLQKLSLTQLFVQYTSKLVLLRILHL